MSHQIDHIGIAVPNLEEAITTFTQGFGLTVSLREEVLSQKVDLAFLGKDGTQLELLSPTDPSSPLQKFLDKKGSGIHHICFRVADIRLELARLEKLGHKIIDKEPRPGANNTIIAFVHPAGFHGVLIELCQKLDSEVTDSP